MSYINGFLGKIIEKCGKDIGFELFKALCSAACAFITQNIGLTLFYIFGTTLFDIITKIYEEINLENIIRKMFKIKNKFKYIIFITIAVLPTGANFVFKESSYFNLLDFLEKRCYNLIPNIFGALILCSFMSYLSKIEVEEILCVVTMLKRELFDIIMRCGFMISFLNAINYSLKNEERFTEIFNAIHLCVIIFSAIVVIGAFVLWLASENEFNVNRMKIYPTFSLLWCFCFLLSCVLVPSIFENTNIDWLVLCFNSITSLIVAWSFWGFIKRKGNIKFKDCPYFQLGLFTIAVIGILLYSVINIGSCEENSIIRQLISGGIILLGVTVMLLAINAIQKKKVNINL